MRWGDMRRSDNIEDREAAGGGGRMPLGGGLKLGGGAMILIVIVSLLFGVNPMEFLGMMDGAGPAVAPAPVPQAAPTPGSAARAPADPQKEMVTRILGDTEEVWTALFTAMGSRYEPPKLVLFRGSIASMCGNAASSMSRAERKNSHAIPAPNSKPSPL